MALKPGSRLLHYELIEQIGEGGMGQVYAAQDTKLKRKVALKVLPESVAGQPERLQRFQREAEVVAALGHPNIVTIHSVDESDGLHFITMELVEGQALSELLTGKALPLRRLLEIAIPLADAVASAHRAGITHRDLKPDNIMLDAEGRLRVLDFGLAKPTETTPFDKGTAMATATAGVTEEGTILGTVAYMSPEQAEGKPVDARSDVFSLGTLLYEMTVGRRPFDGDTGMSTLGSILKVEPTSVTSLDPSLPRHLDRIIRRCLAKVPERRYQSALELRNELEELRADIDSGVHAADPRATADAPARGRWPLVFLGVVAALAIVAVFVVLNRDGNPSGGASGAFELEMDRVPVDASGSVALSPDAKYLALNTADGKGYRLEVAQVSTGSRVAILDSPDAEVYAMRFSPDGDFIYYLREAFSSGMRTLQRIPVLGGDPESLVVDVDTPASFSPDGERLAFVRWQGGGGAHLVVVDADGGNEQLLLDKSPGESLSTPAWSPDGSTIVVPAWRDETEGVFLLAVSVQGSEERPIGSGWVGIFGFSWSPDGNSLILAGTPNESEVEGQIWEVSYPGGEKRRITRDLNEYRGVTLSADGEALVTVQVNRQSWISVVEPGSGRAMERVTTSGSRLDGNGLVWTADGRIVHCARVAGEWNLWITDPETKQHRQLTRLGSCSRPRLTSDGRTVLFVAMEAATWKLWKTDVEGRNPVLLADDNVVGLGLTPDDSWAVYLCGPGGNQGAAVCRVPLDVGEPARLSEQFPTAASIALSPEGDRAAVSFSRDAIGKVAIVPLDGGEPTILELDEGPDGPQFPGDAVWSPDGTAMLYEIVEDGMSNIWRRAVDGSPPERLTDFHRSAGGELNVIRELRLTPDGTALNYERWDGAPGSILRRGIDTGNEEVVFRFPPEGRTAGWTLSRDGRRLALRREQTTSSVILLRNFR